VKHAERHPSLDVEGCFGCKVAGVSFGANSTTTRGAQVAATNRTARNWDKDMPAYKRLRANGLQPRGIDGSAVLEARAETAAQVEGRPDVERLVARGLAE
jgi:hypothetical protein